jgi:hypothetical protein
MYEMVGIPLTGLTPGDPIDRVNSSVAVSFIGGGNHEYMEKNTFPSTHTSSTYLFLKFKMIWASRTIVALSILLWLMASVYPLLSSNFYKSKNQSSNDGSTSSDHFEFQKQVSTTSMWQHELYRKHVFMKYDTRFFEESWMI